MLIGLRRRKSLLMLFAGCLVLATVDLCGLSFHEHHADESVGGAAALATLRCAGCDGDCDGPCEGHHEPEDCSSCPCLCHLAAILQLPVPTPARSDTPTPVDTGPVQRLADFNSCLFRPPLQV